MNVPDKATQREIFLATLSHEMRTKFVALVLAHQYRRGRARNAAVQFGTGRSISPPFLSGSMQDMAIYYQHLLNQADLEDAATNIYEMVLQKKHRAESIKYRLESERDQLSREEARELLEEMNNVASDIESLTILMEEFGDA